MSYDAVHRARDRASASIFGDRRRLAETPGKDGSEADVLDQRLLPFAVLVREGQVVERHWDFFRATYFPGMNDEGAIEALFAWGERNGVAASLHLSSREVGGTLSPTAHVRLTLRK